MDFPADKNRKVLQRMRDEGDLLDRPRIIEFCFGFPHRDQAIEFAASVDNVEYELCISCYKEKGMWQAIVKKHMIPDHDEITWTEADLNAQAESVGGFSNGWGCMRVTR